MAIAVSPAASLSPPSRRGGSRGVAVSWPPASFEGQESSRIGKVPGPDELVDIAEGLAGVAAEWPRIAGLAHRQCELMVASDTLEAWVITWPPGGSIELHDHGGSWGAVSVVAGELVETSVAQTYSGELALRTRMLRQDSMIRIADHHLHDIANVSGAEALSVHVYAPRLTSMSYYRIDGATLEVSHTVEYQFGEVVI